MAERQISQGKTRDHHPIYPPHLLSHLPGGDRALRSDATSPRCDCLACGSCSSSRDFAHSFLPTGPRDQAVTVQLAVPSTRVRRGLSPPSHLDRYHCDPNSAYALRAMPSAHRVAGGGCPPPAPTPPYVPFGIRRFLPASFLQSCMPALLISAQP